MNIAVYASALFKNGNDEKQNFIVETFLSLTKKQYGDRFFIMTDSKKVAQHSFSSSSNIEIIILKPDTKNALLKKIWWEVKLPRALKRIRADFLISFDGICSLASSIPQCILIEETGKIRSSYLKKARILVLMSQFAKVQLAEKYTKLEEKTVVIYPSGGKEYKPATEEKRETIKREYSDGKEFFLYNGLLPGKESFIGLLKAFSHFKKRQQSGLNLLLLLESNSFFEKNLATYKYRNDVKFIGEKEKNTVANITAAAYAVILPHNSNRDIIVALNAMRSGVPVIASRNSVVTEVAGDAAEYAEAGNVKEIGEKMIRLYTNENYRAGLIEKGKTVADSFTHEHAAELLWQSILKALQ